jgi:3-oxoacyl-[acyl-carrier-protein] synthase-3
MTTFPNPSPISLIDISTYLPEKRVSADYYAQFASTDDLRGSSMFRVPKFRHHAAKDETNTDMVERAAIGLLARHGRSVLAGVDILLTHSQKPDMFFHGAGGGIAHRLGITPRIVLDLHNGGCAALPHCLDVARHLLTSNAGRTALIAIAQNMAGQFFDQPEIRTKAQAAIPGDGAAVALRYWPPNAAPTANTPAKWSSAPNRGANIGKQALVTSTSTSHSHKSAR